MELKWYGHSAFLITAQDGIRILTDPCAPKTGYYLHDIACDAVTSSHNHYDHYYFEAADGSPRICCTPEHFTVGSVSIQGLLTWHDNQNGVLRGPNIIFVFDVDGMRVVHLGDLGHIPDDKTLKKIGHPDILLAPVGGVFTIDALQCMKLYELLQPKVLVPMHYWTETLTLPLEPLDNLLDKSHYLNVLHSKDCSITFKKETLPDQCIAILNYASCE